MTPKMATDKVNAPAVNPALKELSGILEMVTGMTIEQVADDVISGKPEHQMILEVSAHVRHTTEDPLKAACEEMARDMGVNLEDFTY